MSKNNIPQTPATIAIVPQLKFRIPLYQRPYAWTTSQVKLLLEDLWQAFNKDENSNYHIGIMSVADAGDGSGTLDIIDGQQRMTTLMLIGKAAEGHAPEWNAFLTSDRLALYGRPSEQPILLNPQVYPKSIMGRAFECAEEFLADKSKEFSKFIFNHAAFFLSQAPHNYSVVDKNQQFVRLNNRGKQLEKHEILKVRLSSMIKNNDDRSTFLQHWNAMLECLSEQPVANSGSEDETETLAQLLVCSIPESKLAKERLYSSIVSVPEFLLIALARHKPDFDVKIKPDNLLYSFQKLDAVSVIEFGKLLDIQTKILRRFFIFTNKSGRTAYELGLEEWGKNADAVAKKEGDADFDALIMVQSFLHVSTEPGDWLIPAFNWCETKEQNSESIEPSALIEALEKIDSEIQDKKKPLPSLDVMEFGNVRHYWFYRLDYELWKAYVDKGKQKGSVWASMDSQAEELVKGFQFRKCGSVEHINPQNPKESVADPTVNLFGNLALISGSRNSAFSNGPRAGKRQMIFDSKYTESLKMIHFLCCDEDTIRTGRNMYSLLAKSIERHLNATSASSRAICQGL